MFQLTDRDEGLVLVDHLDLDAQLRAIKDLLRRNRIADESLTAKIDELTAAAEAADGTTNEHLQDVRIDHLQSSVYQDAAHSMAAIGMIAPLLESFLIAAFAAIRDLDLKALSISSEGRRAAHAAEAEFWNPRCFWTSEKLDNDIAGGAIQLTDAIGLAPFLPKDLAATLRAIFSYRNKMFHNGFEWPLIERQRFEKLIAEHKWPEDWFQRSMSGDRPWIIYMSDVLIAHSLEIFEAMLKGFGAFLKAHR